MDRIRNTGLYNRPIDLDYSRSTLTSIILLLLVLLFRPPAGRLGRPAPDQEQIGKEIQKVTASYGKLNTIPIENSPLVWQTDVGTVIDLMTVCLVSWWTVRVPILNICVQYIYNGNS